MHIASLWTDHREANLTGIIVLVLVLISTCLPVFCSVVFLVFPDLVFAPWLSFGVDVFVVIGLLYLAFTLGSVLCECLSFLSAVALFSVFCFPSPLDDLLATVPPFVFNPCEFVRMSEFSSFCPVIFILHDCTLLVCWLGEHRLTGFDFFGFTQPAKRKTESA